MRTLWWSLPVLLAAMLAGCGTPGAPQPPSLELPRPVADLAAERQGDRVVLTWTLPQETTDKQRLRHPGQTRICRVLQPQLAAAPGEPLPVPVQMTGCAEVARITPQATASGPRGRPIASFADVLVPEIPRQYALGAAVYAIEVLNDRGRSAGLSNQVAAPLAPTLPPPPRVEAHVTADGVLLTWTGERADSAAPAGPLTFRYRVLRRESTPPPRRGQDAALGTRALNPEGTYTFADATAEWEKEYLYTVTPETVVTSPSSTAPITVLGTPASTAVISVHDVFPPAAPAGVQAVFTEIAGRVFMDLTWTPNQEPDLAGYNVYWREAGGTAQKLNPELLRAPATRDAGVIPGHTYLYSVSAVDLRGNESARSAETSESVPRP